MQFLFKTFDELNTHELYDLLSLRQEIFVVEQDCAYQDCDGDNDKKGHHFLVYDNGILVAYSRIMERGLSYPNEASIGRIVTKSTHRKTGLGKIMMEKIMTYIPEQLGTDQIRIAAQVYAIPFYQKVGFEPIGEEFLEDGIPHVNMITASVTDKNYYIEH